MKTHTLPRLAPTCYRRRTLPLVHHDDLNNILAPIRPGVINPSPAYTQQVWQENAGPSIKTEESCEGGNEERMLSVCSG